MSDLYNELLQKSIDREAKKIAFDGATEHDRYGHLLDAFKGRNIMQEEANKHNDSVSQLLNKVKNAHKQRENEAAEDTRKLQRIVLNNIGKDRREVNEFLDKNKERLDKARENIRKEQNKTYL